MMRTLLSLTLTLLVLSSVVAQHRPAFPVPRAEAEFVPLFGHLKGLGSRVEGSRPAFTLLALPYAPLDLQVTRAASHDEATALKNFYLGIAGAISGVDALAAANSFHCGKGCVESRRDGMKDKLPRIAELVREFDGVPRLTIIAQWGVADEFRVNNVFEMLGRTNESLPSPVMGFVPSDRWRKLASIDEYLAEIKITRERFDPLLARTRELDIAAIVREAHGGIRVVRVGIGDNEAGMLFVGTGAAKPERGRKLADGRQYVVVEQIKPGVFYYETS